MEHKLTDNKRKYVDMREEMKNKIDNVTFAKRRLEMMM